MLIAFHTFALGFQVAFLIMGLIDHFILGVAWSVLAIIHEVAWLYALSR